MKLKKRTIKYMIRKKFKKDRDKIFKLFLTALSQTPKMDGSQRDMKEYFK